MRLYFDTCIANDIFVLLQTQGGDKLRPKDVKQPLEKKILEYIALYYLLELDDQWGLEFGSSPLMKEEVERIHTRFLFATEKKSTLLEVYALLIEKTLFPELLPVPEHLFKQVSRVLPGGKDVKHVCQAVVGGWDYFMTTDFKTILKYTRLLSPLGIIAISPRKFVEDKFMTLEQLTRTLHGSWTSLREIEESWINEVKASAR